MVDIATACRSWYAQCTLCSRPWTLTGTVLGMFVVACCCATTGALLGAHRKLWSSADAVLVAAVQFLDKVVLLGRAMLGSTMDTCSASSRVDFGRDFHDFLFEGVDSALELDSFWPACRRQRQWHVPCWFCWFDALRAMFSRLQAVC